VGAIKQAVSAGVAGGRFYFDGLKGKAVSDVFGEYADTPGALSLSLGRCPHRG